MHPSLEAERSNPDSGPPGAKTLITPSLWPLSLSLYAFDLKIFFINVNVSLRIN